MEMKEGRGKKERRRMERRGGNEGEQGRNRCAPISFQKSAPMIGGGEVLPAPLVSWIAISIQHDVNYFISLLEPKTVTTVLIFSPPTHRDNPR